MHGKKKTKKAYNQCLRKAPGLQNPISFYHKPTSKLYDSWYTKGSSTCHFWMITVGVTTHQRYLANWRCCRDHGFEISCSVPSSQPGNRKFHPVLTNYEFGITSVWPQIFALISGLYTTAVPDTVSAMNSPRFIRTSCAVYFCTKKAFISLNCVSWVL